jgi:DNA-binding NarL/FixJ family response regulator
MERIVSVVLAGRSYLLKAGIEQFLSEFAYVSTDSSFNGAEPALFEKIQNLKPDIVIIIPDKPYDRLKQLLQLLSKSSSVKLIAITENPLPDAIKGKFSEVVPASADKMELTRVINKALSEKGINRRREESDNKLSEREIDILKHVAYGLTNQEIADKLFLSVHTVTTHRKNITGKLGIKTVSGLTVYALMNKLVKPSDVKH